jgi:hypothetical protein
MQSGWKCCDQNKRDQKNALTFLGRGSLEVGIFPGLSVFESCFLSVPLVCLFSDDNQGSLLLDGVCSEFIRSVW